MSSRIRTGRWGAPVACRPPGFAVPFALAVFLSAALGLALIRESSHADGLRAELAEARADLREARDLLAEARSDARDVRECFDRVDALTAEVGSLAGLSAAALDTCAVPGVWLDAGVVPLPRGAGR